MLLQKISNEDKIRFECIRQEQYCLKVDDFMRDKEKIKKKLQNL